MAENEQNNKVVDKNSLFREKSLERIESPEKLNDYLRVTSPGVWLVLSMLIVLLIGVCIWGFFGHIDATVPAAVVSQDGQSICYVPKAALEGVIKNRIVKVDGRDLELVPSVLEPEVVSETMDVYIMLAGKLSVGDIVYQVPLAENIDEGTYSGTLVTETLSPVKLFF